MSSVLLFLGVILSLGLLISITIDVRFEDTGDDIMGDNTAEFFFPDMRFCVLLCVIIGDNNECCDGHELILTRGIDSDGTLDIIEVIELSGPKYNGIRLLLLR